ncbi:MAG: hypothetical protein AAF202_08765 [Pseudomonadota bacterium]
MTNKTLSEWILDTTLRELISAIWQSAWVLARATRDLILAIARLRPRHIREFVVARKKDFSFVTTSVAIHATGILLIQVAGSPFLNDNLEDLEAATEVEISVIAVSQDVEAAYDNTSDILVKPKPKKKRNRPSRFEKLLAMLGNTANAAAPGRKTLSEKQLEKLLASSSLAESQKLEQALLNSKSGQGLSQDILNKLQSSEIDHKKYQKQVSKMRDLIQGQYPSFRSCYEKALLLDQDLQGRVGLFVRIEDTPNVQVQFRGQGTGKSKGQLINCLKAKTKSLSFPSGSKGVAVKFNLVFMG